MGVGCLLDVGAMNHSPTISMSTELGRELGKNLEAISVILESVCVVCERGKTVRRDSECEQKEVSVSVCKCEQCVCVCKCAMNEERERERTA